jgi:DNA-binding transcriptional LysR family regulator
MRDLNEVQCFVRAVELKSLTAAAKALGLPKSSVSRKIKGLEERLGITLLLRTTRALSLTDAGKRFFDRSILALKELDHAEEALDESRDHVDGTLRITGPDSFTTGPFNDLIASFLNDYPEVKVELLLTDRTVDLISEGYDLAFRVGELEDSSLIAKKIIVFDLQVVGSPSYLKSRGIPRNVADLAQHECLGFAPSGEVIPWRLKGPAGTKAFTPNGRYVANHMLSLKEAALKGVGLALVPVYAVEQELKDKSLKVVCQDWISFGAPVYLVYPGQKFLAPKMRAFIDYASEKLRE